MAYGREITHIIKRDGSLEPFNPEKIKNAIHKALVATQTEDGELAANIADEAIEIVRNRFAGKTPTVEDVQDIVEEVLIRRGLAKVAKAYILYRQRRTELREAKAFLGVRDELKLSLNAITVLRRRYLLKDDRGEVVETPSQMFWRVARTIASVERRYDPKADVEAVAKRFYDMMSNLLFLPNSPTLMNAGTPLGQLSACFVVPIEDSLESILDAVRAMAIITRTGGGTGFSFSKLRPRGDIISTTKGVASGPVSFMRIFDVVTDVIKQGGRRRGANMGVLRFDHPDIFEFVTAKAKEGFLTNFNLSVAVTDDFMEAAKQRKEIELINPRTGEAVRTVNAGDLFELIATMAWQTGDPGLLFIDEVNRHNPIPHVGVIESTNPCGEQPLLPWESCNLGSIDVSKLVYNGDVDWDKLGELVRDAVRFLDDVIDANKFPLPQIEEMTKANRKIGLGIMGFADLLVQLWIPYDSQEAISLAEKLMNFITSEARKASEELGEQRGSFPNFEGSVWDQRGYGAMRNATVTTIAPTGSISIIAGCSSGIEPLFAIAFIRNVLEGTRLLEVNKHFETIARERGFYSRSLMTEIARKGSIRDVPEIPEDVKRVFVTAHDISPEWHVRMQAAFQKYTDNAVSKTINMPYSATIEDVKRAFMLAYELKCKGITVYRYGSKKEQVLYIGTVLRETSEELEFVTADSEYSGGCPAPFCPTH